MRVQGTNDPRFSAVRAAFESCFADGLETGGAVAVMLDGIRTIHDSVEAAKASFDAFRQDLQVRRLLRRPSQEPATQLC